MNTLAKIMVAYYKDEQIPNCRVWPKDIFEPWDVTFNLNSSLLEYDLLKKIRDDGVMNRFKYTGLMSHSAYGKLAMTPDYVRAEIQEGMDNDVDAILINPAIACNAFFRNGIEQAQLIGQNKIEFIFNRIGFDNITSVNLPYHTFIMCSYIIAKSTFWEKYFELVDDVLSKADYLSEIDDEFKNAYYGNANYRVRANNYDYRPFIIERIPQILLATEAFKIKYIESTKAVFARKFGHRAKAIHSLYELKKKCLESEEANDSWEKIRKPFIINQAQLYKLVTAGEFGRSKQQEEKNMAYFYDGNLQSDPVRKAA
jgi:hypothetical protein